MARIMGIDYGKKRTGIAVTDELQIAVHPYKALKTNELWDELTNYFNEHLVEKIVFGYPTHKDGTETHLVSDINNIIKKIKKQFQHIEVDFQDESFTSVEAKEIMLFTGVKKKKRQDKSRVDLISAVLILQKYLKHI